MSISKETRLSLAEDHLLDGLDNAYEKEYLTTAERDTLEEKIINIFTNMMKTKK